MMWARAGKGQPVAALDNMPELYPWLEIYWRAFGVLSSRRQYVSAGFSVMPQAISFENICLYAEKFMVYNEEELEKFLQLMIALDDVFMAHQSEKAKQEADKRAAENGNPGKGRRRGKRR